MPDRLGSPRFATNIEARRAERERAEKLRKVAFAAAVKCRRYGRYSDADIEDAVSAGVERALAEPSGSPEREAKLACQGARNHLRACSRAEERLQNLGNEMAAEDSSPFVGGEGKRKEARQLVRPKPADARALAQAIEIYERSVLASIMTGELARASRVEKLREQERRMYLHGARIVASHARVTIDMDWVADQLVDFRQREIKVQCSICAPTSLWVKCEHTAPIFEKGVQVGGVDLRGRGRRSKRGPLLLSFNDGPHVDHNNYQAEDAAARLSTELLRLCGVDPYVKHTLERQREKASERERASFIRDWRAGRVQSGERAWRKARQRDAKVTPEQRELRRVRARREELIKRLLESVNVEIDALCLCEGSGGRLCRLPPGHDGNHWSGAERWDAPEGTGSGNSDDQRTSLKARKAFDFDALRLPDLEAAASDLDRRGYVLNGTWRDGSAPPVL